MCKLLKMPLATLVLLSATSCARNGTATVPAPAPSEYCLIAKGISFSAIKPGQVEDATNKYDTDETVKAVTAHDLAYEKVCGGH